jgi:putative spermidine/putrescine transport system substrate-binding protein
MAFQLMNFIATNAKAGADYARMTHYAISNNAAIDLLEPELAAKLPTSPDLEGKILVKDDAWWADNLEPATEAFKEWQLGDSG